MAVDSDWEDVSSDSDWEDISPPQQDSVLSNAGKDISGMAETFRRGGQGIIDFPSDVYQSGKQIMQGGSPSDTPIGQDVKTLGNVALQSLPHAVTDPQASNLPLVGQTRIEPGSIFRQYQDLAAQPLKSIPGKIGQTMQQAYPGNPLTEHPVNSALALAPLAKPLFNAAREIPGVQNGLNKASNYIRENYVADNARRALGKFPTKMPIEEANKVGLDAMDQGVIKNPLTNPLSSSRKSMLGRASELNDSIGENIGSFLDGQSEGLNATKAMQELDQVSSQFMDDPQIMAKVNRAKKLIYDNSEGLKIEPFSRKIKRGPSYTEEIPDGFKEIPAKPEVETTFTGFKEHPASMQQAEIPTNMWTGQAESIPYDMQRSGSLFGTSREISTPQTQLVGKNKNIEIPGNEVVVQSGGKPLNWTGYEEPLKMPFAKANKLKSLFQKKVNYNSDAATQGSGKAIAGNLRNSIDTQLDQLANKLGKQEGMGQFLSDKKMFGSTSKMVDALEGQVGRDARNNPISLPSVIMTAGKGIPAGLITEWAKRYGSATAASMANDVAQVIKNGSLPEVSASVGVTPAVSASVAPHGDMVKQDGKVYKWNGTEYVEVQ